MQDHHRWWMSRWIDGGGRGKGMGVKWMERGGDEMMGNRWTEGGGWMHEWMKEQTGRWEDERLITEWTKY